MKPALVIYATRQGHTRRIAEQVVESMQAREAPAESVDAACLPPRFSLSSYSSAILIASVHRGRHEEEMAGFVKRHVAELERIPTAFLSVSLSEAGAEDLSAPSRRRAKAAADVDRMIQDFLAESGWRPARIKAVAGALLYTKYNFLLRILMKRIARQAGGSTDTSKDRDYTDWADLDQFVDSFTQDFPADALTER